MMIFLYNKMKSESFSNGNEFGFFICVYIEHR